MAARKINFVLLIGLLSLSSWAQKRPLVYGGFEYYRNTGFKSDMYANLNFGIQVFRYEFLAPEIGFNHYHGILVEASALHPEDPNARPPRKTEGRFSTALFSVAPKLIFGNAEAALVVIPQYSTGKIVAKGKFLVDRRDHYALEDQEKVKEDISFFSIAAGVQGDFFDLGSVTFGLFLHYHFLDSEAALEKIEAPEGFQGVHGGSSEGLGIGLKAYVDVIGILN